jgi:hypothetical protein
MKLTDKGGDFEQPPIGTHVARSIGLIDIGTQQSEYQGQKTFRRQIIIKWELCNEMMTKGEYEGKPFVVSKFYTASLSEKSNLRKDLVNWRGREFTADELAGFAAKNILDKGCMLQITEKEGKHRVTGVMAIPKGTTVSPAVNPIEYFSLEPDEFDMEKFNQFSEKMQNMIAASPEFKTAIGAPVETQKEDDGIPFDEIPF